MVKDIISYLLSFILVILIIAIFFIIFFINVFNAEYIQSKLSKSNYYEKLQETINNSFTNYVMQSGMDNSVFENIYDIEKLKIDTGIVISSIFDNCELNIDNNIMKEKLDNNIRNYIKENNLLINKTAEEQIQTFEDTIINTYISSVTYSEPVIKILGNVFNKFNTIIPLTIISITALLIINIVLLIIINKQNKRRLFNNISTISFTLAGLSIIGIILEKHFLNIQTLIVINENLSILIQIIVKDLYMALYGISVIGITTGIALSIAKTKKSKCRH